MSVRVSSFRARVEPAVKEGNKDEISVSNNDTESLLDKSLKELKKLNLHLSLITDTTLDNTEV